jgi:son of sevenless-like protein
MASQLQQPELDTNAESTLTVGAQFWELAEGLEFDVYLKYALTVYNQTETVAKLQVLMSSHQPHLNESLEKRSPGLADCVRYLLPKLLLGSVYHALYLYETVEQLAKWARDPDDKEFLKNTLDTMTNFKFELARINFVSSRQRPVETSFRKFHHHFTTAQYTLAKPFYDQKSSIG